MAKIENYWKIITPNSNRKDFNSSKKELEIGKDSRNPYMYMGNDAQVAYNAVYLDNYTNALTRSKKYEEFDIMDRGDISKALDIIADHMSEMDSVSKLPFYIEFYSDDSENKTDAYITTLKTHLIKWVKINNLQIDLFLICRMVLKYGDVFFVKRDKFSKMEYIPPGDVYGIGVSDYGETVSYHIKNNKTNKIEIIDADFILHFSNRKTFKTEKNPFGTSILEAIRLDYIRLNMLEQAALIYRLSRSPEKRVIYVDVGNKPPNQIETYMENIKMKWRQKKVPSNQSDITAHSTFNADTMLEDYFLPVTANGRQSRIETLPAGNWDAPEIQYFEKRIIRTLSVPGSYMIGQTDTNAAISNDGKLGTAYIEEQTFAKFCKRCQNNIIGEFNKSFKQYIKDCKIVVDINDFGICLENPQNYEEWRQIQLDSERLNNFKNIEDSKVISMRYKLKRYLGLKDDEIQSNEALLFEELNLKNSKENFTELQLLYDQSLIEKREAIEGIDKLGNDSDSMSMGENNEINDEEK